jgi:hypothetical protein
MIQRVPLPDLRPDQSNISGVLLKAENVYPAADGYRAIGSVSEVSDPLEATFNGGVSTIATDGTSYLLAGTAAGLYKFTAGGAWATLLTGLSITGRWRFSQINNVAIAVNGGTTYQVNLATAVASVLTGAPTGTCTATIGDHIAIGQSNGDVTMVKWSAFGDETGWTIGTDQCGEQPMQTGGAIMGIAGGEYGIILQRERIVRMTQTTDPETPFVFDEVSNNFGCASAATVAQAGRSVFFRSDRGFMVIEDGQVLKPIGTEKVDRTFDAMVSRDSLDTVFTGVDPSNKLVYWGIPGSPGTVWIYNFELDKWTTASFAFEGLMPGFTTSITLEEFAALYPNLDTAPYSLDDPRWTGGSPRMYMFTTAHKAGVLAGPNLAAQFDMTFQEFAAGHRARVRKVRPVADVTGGLTVVLNAKARLGDADAITTAGTITSSGVVPIRASGRYIATSLRIAAGQTWGYVHGFEVECEAGGTR